MREGITFRNIKAWRDQEPCLRQTANVRFNLTISRHRNLFTYLSRELSRAVLIKSFHSSWLSIASLISLVLSSPGSLDRNNNFQQFPTISNIGNELIKTVQTDSYGWIGRKTTILGWNNTSSKRQAKGEFGHLVQISVSLKLDSESLYLKREILRVAIHYICFFFYCLLGDM